MFNEQEPASAVEASENPEQEGTETPTQLYRKRIISFLRQLNSGFLSQLIEFIRSFYDIFIQSIDKRSADYKAQRNQLNELLNKELNIIITSYIDLVKNTLFTLDDDSGVLEVFFFI